VGTLYIGGGTPTTLSPDQLIRLFRLIGDHVSLERGAEVTVEANPNTLTHDTIALLRGSGVNRLSIGVQSFSDEVLAALGRAHSAAEALRSYAAARRGGFDNIGIDLIYGVPGQGPDRWAATLRAALDLRPEHLSLYSLSADDGSRLKALSDAGEALLPDDDVAAAMYLDALPALERAGYVHYEISNWCRPQRECRHNMNYWERGEYLGLGPSAWSFIGGKRTANVRDRAVYVDRLAAGRPATGTADGAAETEELAETLLLRLRTAKGVDLAWFGRRFGGDQRRSLEARAASLGPSGLIMLDGATLRLTARGMLLSTEAIGRLLP
jgi:oxygen-independent coproporphyrinogen-3 oxidase